jgi:hypothetical protein
MAPMLHDQDIQLPTFEKYILCPDKNDKLEHQVKIYGASSNTFKYDIDTILHHLVLCNNKIVNFLCNSFTKLSWKHIYY